MPTMGQCLGVGSAASCGGADFDFLVVWERADDLLVRDFACAESFAPRRPVEFPGFIASLAAIVSAPNSAQLTYQICVYQVAAQTL
jgi:hypothetical protein